METLKACRRLVFLFLFLALQSSAKVAPEFKRESLQTPHFRIHTPPQYRKFSETFAEKLEDAYRILTAELDWEPVSRIDVVVRGDTDLPNGTAAVFPYNRLVIHAVPPEPWGFFSESDDWIATLAIHELTHVVANDETRGIFDFFRSIVGTAAKINPYQPAWLVEGLAVFSETEQTSAGRGRSVWNSMVVREDLENRRLGTQITLDRLNDGFPGWPEGHLPYLYGYVLTEAIAARGGKDAPAKVSTANSGQFPFVIDRSLKRTIGLDFAELWTATVALLRKGYEEDRALLAKETETAYARLTETGRKTRGSVESKRNGESRIYFIRDSVRSGVGLSSLDLPGPGNAKTPTHQDLTFWRWDGGTRLSVSHDGRYLAYSRNAPFQEHSLFSDVYLYDLEKNRESRITLGARASDPALSEDFDWDARQGKVAKGFLLYVKNLDDGNQAIARWDEGGEAILYRGREFERLGAPTLGTGDYDRNFIFSEKPRTGGERLKCATLPKPETTRTNESLDAAAFDLTLPAHPREVATTPVWGKDGDVYFSGSQGGVFNLRRISAAKLRTALLSRTSVGSERVTHFRSGVLQPVADSEPGSFRAMVYGPGGWDIARVRISETPFSTEGPGLSTLQEKIRSESSADSAVDPGSYSAAPVSVPISEPSAPQPISYSVLPAILPHYWAPDLRRVPDGWSLGIQTSSYDAWEDHRYRLFLGGDTRANFPIWNFNYQFDGFFPTFEFSMRQENRYFANYRESNRIETTEAKVYTPAGWDSFLILGFTGQTSRFFGERESTGGFELGWTFDRTRVFSDSIDRAGERGLRGGAELTGYYVGQERFSSLSSRLEARIPSLFSRHFIRVSAQYASANNRRLASLYYLGGGEETIAGDRAFLLRGYVPGTIFGREILTANAEYIFPLQDFFRGFGTFPLFLERTRLKVFLDTGSAEFVADQRNDLEGWPLGAGIHALTDLNVLYRVPLTIGLGYDHGFSRERGGERRIVLGIFSPLARPSL